MSRLATDITSLGTNSLPSVSALATPSSLPSKETVLLEQGRFQTGVLEERVNESPVPIPVVLVAQYIGVSDE